MASSIAMPTPAAGLKESAGPGSVSGSGPSPRAGMSGSFGAEGASGSGSSSRVGVSGSSGSSSAAESGPYSGGARSASSGVGGRPGEADPVEPAAAQSAPVDYRAAWDALDRGDDPTER